MTRDRYSDRARAMKRTYRNRRIALVGILLTLSMAVGGTLAYLIAGTDRVNNQFEPAYVTCQVNANWNGSFDVKNTGDVNAYIRASFTVNWLDENDNVRGIAPAASDYTLSLNTADWLKDANTGYYYYKHSVAPKALTEDLITSFELAQGVSAPAGYELNVEMIAEAIQADGDTDAGSVPAFTDAWGISSVSGS